MSVVSPLLAMALLSTGVATPASGDPPVPARRAQPIRPLVSFVSPGDYPLEAIRAGKEGTVRFRLSIDAAGRVEECRVSASSGSAILDSTTCRLVKKAKFLSATDPSGRPVADSFESRIVWRLPRRSGTVLALPERPATAIGLWRECIAGEVAKMTVTDISADDVAGSAFGACEGLEQVSAKALADAGFESLEVDRAMRDMKNDYAASLGSQLSSRRTVLSAPRK